LRSAGFGSLRRYAKRSRPFGAVVQTIQRVQNLGMSLMVSLRSRLRSLLGQPREQVPRGLPRRGRKPRIGAYVVHVQQGLRLTVQAGLSDELWQWLMGQGWRVPPIHPDRRTYRDIPASLVTRLIDADSAQRTQVLEEAMKSAKPRPAPLPKRGGGA